MKNISLREIYIKQYGYHVTVFSDCLLVGFSSDKVDFVIKEVFNDVPLRQIEIEQYFDLIEEIADGCLCNEKRILAYGGWTIEEEGLTNNPYQYEGKTIYGQDYFNSLLTGNHIELFAHNEYAYEKISEGLSQNNRGAVVQATGTGKTYLISRYVSEQSRTDKILIVAPTVVIFEEIKRALKQKYINVDFMTFAYIGLLLNDKSELNKLQYKHIIIDEFHHAESEVWGAALNVIFNNNPDAVIFGTSATPVRPSDSINVVDTVFEGKLLHEFNLSTAITTKVLPNPKVIQSVYNLGEVIEVYENKFKNANLTGEREQQIRSKLNSLKDAFNSYSVTEIIKKHVPLDVKKFFVFCPNKEELKAMKPIVVNWFKMAGFEDIHVFDVHSDLTSKRNIKTIKDFQKENNSLSLLFSIDMLSEGLHVKHVDGAMFLRKTNSYVICLQQLGRTLKAGADKQPIILDFVNNINNAITYEGVIGVAQFPKGQKRTRKESIHFSISDKIIDDISGYIEQLEKLWNSNEISWDFQYNQVKEYLIKEKKLPTRTHKLGEWVSRQRKSLKNNTLSKEKILQLSELGIDAAKDSNPFIWEEKFLDLKNYIKLHKQEPNLSKDCSRHDLGCWVKIQRASFAKGRLSDNRIKQLKSIGITLQKTYDFKWTKTFNELKKYKKKYKSFPSIKIHNGFYSLAVWITSQRRSYKQNKLSKERFDKLNSIGFNWGKNESTKEE